MKLIINTVNLKIGGAFQRSISFTKELKALNNFNHEFHIFYNKDFGTQIEIKSYPNSFKFYFFDSSPAQLSVRKKITNRFNYLENKIKPDVVFSFVGPSYWRPKSKHLVGFGVPHIVYNDFKYVKSLSLKTKLEMLYKRYWTKKEADFFVVQTEDVRERLAEILNIQASKIFLVSNGPGNQYRDVIPKGRNKESKKKLLLISTYRPSKNFEIIKGVISYLKKDKNFKYEFHITIQEEFYNKIFKGYEDYVINHGHVFTKDCPELYNQCDAMFLPSHLECFSASYPEAMKMEKPILTCDLSFAKTVCEDAAIYFDNTDPKQVAEKIISLFNDDVLYNSLVEKGKKRLLEFDDSNAQAQKYLDICDYIAKK